MANDHDDHQLVGLPEKASAAPISDAEAQELRLVIASPVGPCKIEPFDGSDRRFIRAIVQSRRLLAQSHRLLAESRKAVPPPN